jgi:hypothetical protein
LELPDQPEFLEGGLELGAEDAPLDPFDGEQGRLHRGALRFALEVGTQACAQVAGAADVEHLLVAVAEEVHPGPRRRAAHQRSLGVHTSLAGSSQGAQLGNATRSQLVRNTDQMDQDLGRRLRVG